ncbi:MFS general substrate transporter [Desarmillaria tabescens]|uniref:MFS general substrate transporter n=1 Tax=Armillaria tabescens TaxID=1929756 RepID=A0AA39J6M6_ARMTA|nr:MFS general substrate transporter [Desarmillaria tabescens]KAK0436347.1 MFS general substrate transporter [Desarmillaria tabescens]
MKIALQIEERRLVRRLDERILLLACFLYLFAYLDRSNLGNARLQGLPEDILNGDPTGVLFDWITSAFYFFLREHSCMNQIICQIPATIVSKLIPPHYWLAGAAVGWGLSSTLMSTAFNFGGLLTARVFLGIFEAGFGPGIPLYFCNALYTKEEMGLRVTVAGAFGGLIAFGISTSNIAIAHWRLLLIVEIAVSRMNRNTSGDVGNVHERQIYTGGVIYFGLNCALASISAFLPTIIQTFGNTNAIAQLLTVPPYAVAAVVLTLFSYASDRLQTRGWFMAIASLIGAIGYLLLLTVPSNNHVRYFATFCITSGTYTTIGIIIAWFAHNLGSETKRATCGSVLGSHIFPKTEVSCALEFLAAICAVILHFSYRLENKRRNALYGVPGYNTRVDTSELADKAPNFRYVT